MIAYGDINEKIKTKVKFWTRCNWPELSNYCGCCELSTGIYIRCLVTVVLTTVTFVFNCYLLKVLMNTRYKFNKADLAVLEEYLEEAVDTSQDLHGMFLILDGVLAYYILWNNFKIFYIIRNLWTIHAVYKKNRKTLKILLYIAVPSWIFDGFLSLIGTMLLRHMVKVLFVISFLSEGYNLLAINSKYKQISGKSRIVRDSHLETTTEIIDPNLMSPHLPVTYTNQPHCSSCTCYRLNETNTEELTVRHIEESASPISLTPVVEEISDKEELNFKDDLIIYNQEILEGRANSPIVTPTNSGHISNILRRPNTLALKPLEKEKKEDLCDTPVIYDEDQLKVGESPIVEK